MAFNHQDWNDVFLANPDYNNAGAYGVTIHRYQPASGECYWRIIGIHHLTPEENRGSHNLFFDVLGINGDRIRPVVWVHWTWKGMRQDEVASPVQGDKPDNEPVGNIGIGGNQIVYAKCTGRDNVEDADGPSDWIMDVHTNHPDEGDQEGNTIGHHSFYVVWQETIAGEVVHTHNPPSSLVATPISKFQVKLGWIDNNEDESGFRIERALGMSGSWSEIALVGADIISYSDTDLNCNQPYSYRVRTYNDFGVSDYSNAATVTTLACDSDPTPVEDVIGKVKTWQDEQHLKLIVPWLAEVYNELPSGPHLEVLVDRVRLQEIIDQAGIVDIVRLYVQLKWEEDDA